MFTPNYNSYSKYLKGTGWESKKKQARSSKPYRCYCCDYTKELDLHHITYRNIYQEKMQDLVYLCKACHGVVHNKVMKSFLLEFRHKELKVALKHKKKFPRIYNKYKSIFFKAYGVEKK